MSTSTSVLSPIWAFPKLVTSAEALAIALATTCADGFTESPNPLPISRRIIPQIIPDVPPALSDQESAAASRVDPAPAPASTYCFAAVAAACAPRAIPIP